MTRIYEEFGIPLNNLYAPDDVEDLLHKFPEVSNALANSNSRNIKTLACYGVGLEIEAENAQNINSEFWLNTEDNSLRNAGIEYKTRYGTRLGHLPAALLEIEGQAKALKFNFSERTSVHVHIDARMLSVEEVKTMFLLYLLFEKALFRFAGAERQSNVFCVPYGDSNNCYKPSSFVSLIRDSQKYAAINLHTLTSFGTIEFRHMRGNADAQFILTWVYILAHLRLFATHIPFHTFREQLITLKTSSQFNHLKDSVFQGFSNYLTINSKEVDGAISTAKLFL